MNRLSIDLSSEQHKKIKVLASLSGKTIREYVLERLFPDNEVGFNKKTLQAIADIEGGKNLAEYKNIEELFGKLDS